MKRRRYQIQIIVLISARTSKNSVTKWFGEGSVYSVDKQVDKKTFLKEIETILKKVLEIDELNFPLTFDTSLVSGVGMNTLNLSSIDYVDFLVCVETAYNIIYDFDIALYTIGDIYNYIVVYNCR